jgi:transposase-like protein
MPKNSGPSYAQLTKVFADEDLAREWLEAKRWPTGPVCPHCGVIDRAYKLVPKATSSRPVRKGVWKCRDCRKQFTVTIGTIFAETHIPLNKWLYAIHLMCSSKKGVSALQLSRTLEITYKSAWFLAHRVRKAMEKDPMRDKLTGVVEADETYVGGKGTGTHRHPGRPHGGRLQDRRLYPPPAGRRSPLPGRGGREGQDLEGDHPG